MCKKDSPLLPSSPSVKGKRRRPKSKTKAKRSKVSLKSSRKTRTRTRKPKFLSLIDLRPSQESPQMSPDNNNNNCLKREHHQKQQQQQQQLNLFPLHPGNLLEDKDNYHYDNVSMLFNGADNASTTLHGLLDKDDAVATPEEGPPSPSVTTYGYSGCGDASSLVRTAMKGGTERDASEEKWVSYSEVVEKKEMEEVCSCGGGGGGGGDDITDDDGDEEDACCSKKRTKKNKNLLALKLNYQEVLKAWSDHPLYIEGESPQTVPDLHGSAQVLMDTLGGNADMWRVPEMGGNNIGSFKNKEELNGKEDWRKGHREASVLRYKEKRQSRLFAKRIRYEVRKLNAEKRPRLKGRFVKRD